MERTYETQTGCPVAATLDVIGDRWTILILRDLGLGRSGKFKDLLESLEGISPNLLADRLTRLHREGILERSYDSQYPPRAEYCLTEKGEELRPVIGALADWGLKHQLNDEQRAAAGSVIEFASRRRGSPARTR